MRNIQFIVQHKQKSGHDNSRNGRDKKDKIIATKKAKINATKK